MIDRITVTETMIDRTSLVDRARRMAVINRPAVLIRVIYTPYGSKPVTDSDRRLLLRYWGQPVIPHDWLLLFKEKLAEYDVHLQVEDPPARPQETE